MLCYTVFIMTAAKQKIDQGHEHRHILMARKVLSIESAAIEKMAGTLGKAFIDAVNAILGSTGRIVLTGVGKSGHIGRKIAATLASTGSPALFVHAAEAAHGDLGMITERDVVIALSNSGETAEILSILPALRRRGIVLIALTGNMSSSLAKEADIVLDGSVDQEACPLNLAPTASTTVALALGDALAVAALHARGFSEEDFALSHPGGSLGRRLLTYVRDVMRTGNDIPTVPATATVNEAILEITKKRLGMTAIVNEQRELLGIFTDGDLRRLIEKGLDWRNLAVQEVMTSNPSTIAESKLAAEAVNLMDKRRISQLVVVNQQNQVVGALNMHDLFAAKVL
jgi:arabinose-5-phosphate isomerase